MVNLLTWEDVRKELDTDTNCTVLLGNGFSRSYCNQAFNQYEIIQHMPSLQNLSEIMDIEKCIEQTQAKVSDANPSLTVPKTIIDCWIKKQLHKEFIDTLYELIPKSLNDIKDFTDEKLSKYRDFFNCFNKVFTLNYDPLLYWMTMRFINFGDKDIVDYSNLKEQLSIIPEGTKEYTSVKKKLDSSNDKCIKSVRNEMFAKYMKENDDYKLSISCKQEILLEKSIAESEGKILGGWTKVIPEVYKAFETKKTESKLLEEENNKLNSIATSSFETKLKTVEQNKGKLRLSINDGFLSDVWNENNRQSIFYLHGAFHIIENNEETIKIKAEDFNKMVNKIKEKWDSGFEPLTVLESTPEAKLERIKKSPYLVKCFNEFKNISGVLITHGLSFMSSDQHIIDTINNNSKLDKIYVGCYLKPSEEIEKAFYNNDKVSFFDTSAMF